MFILVIQRGLVKRICKGKRNNVELGSLWKRNQKDSRSHESDSYPFENYVYDCSAKVAEETIYERLQFLAGI